MPIQQYDEVEVAEIWRKITRDLPHPTVGATGIGLNSFNHSNRPEFGVDIEQVARRSARSPWWVGGYIKDRSPWQAMR